MKVPQWNNYRYPEEVKMKDIEAFLNYFSKNFESNTPVDVEENLTYIFHYFYLKHKGTTKKDAKSLIPTIKKILESYGNYPKIAEYFHLWLSEVYWVYGDFDSAWETLKTRPIRLEHILYLRANCKDTFIDGDDLIRLFNTSSSGLTKFGREHKNEIQVIATNLLKSFQVEHGKNIVEYFLKSFDYGKLSETDFNELMEYFKNEIDFIKYKEEYLRLQKGKYSQFPGKWTYRMELGIRANFQRTFEQIPNIVEAALLNKLKSIIRECENTIREEMGFPKVGEYWISEADLYRKVAMKYRNEKVIHHGRPLWLGRQHLDIYFPIRNIAIEYQGAQHIKPVDFFGGDEAYKKQVKYDEKKKQLCEKNNCPLIYVYEDYNIEIIYSQIDALIQ